MAPLLVFDIETTPDFAGLRRLYPQHAHLDDAALFAAACTERFGADSDRTFLPHHLQKVCAISCVLRAGADDAASADAQFKVWTLGTAESCEADLIRKFYKLVDHYTPQLLSWNGGGFDLPVLHYRALIHGVPAARYWEGGDEDRDFKFNNYLSRYHSRHLDLMDVLAGYQPRANAGLDEMAKLCGFAGKLGMDGSQVWQAVQAGRLNEVRDYCETDVVNTYLVYTQFQLMRGQWSAQRCAAEQARVRSELTTASEGAAHWQQYLAAWAQP
jgi:predicted PolB exonuclease-like 3'-5' exonuclease